MQKTTANKKILQNFSLPNFWQEQITFSSWAVEVTEKFWRCEVSPRGNNMNGTSPNNINRFLEHLASYLQALYAIPWQLFVALIIRVRLQVHIADIQG